MPNWLPSDPNVQTALLVGAAVVVLGLFVYGLRDVRRFSFYRAWAVGGVAFREGVRRKVLWITPLAMLAVVLLVQLGDPSGERDAIRQAAQAALFASGLVAIVVPLILSCTSLPREVDNKVIFTIVTKPLTRLELLLGKLFGFARLSALVLAIMGVFAYVLLLALNWSLTSRIEERLETALPNESRRPYLEHLAEGGLLRAETIDLGEDLQVYAIPPEVRPDAIRWFPSTEYYAAVPFDLPPEEAEELRQLAAEGEAALQIKSRLAWQLLPGRIVPPGWYPLGVANLDNLPPIRPPLAEVQIFDGDLFNLIPRAAIRGNPFRLPESPAASWNEAPSVLLSYDQTQRVAEEWLAGRAYVGIWGGNNYYFFGIAGDSVRIEIVDRNGNVLRTIEPDLSVGGDARGSILLRTYLGTNGLGFTGAEDERPAPYGVLAYRDTPAPPVGEDGTVGFELVGSVERTGGVLDEGDITRLEVRVVNIGTGFVSEPRIVEPETGQPVYFTVPAEAVEGGDYDLRIRTLSRGHIFSFHAANARFVTASEPYWLNLAKALMAQWLLSVLVAACGLAFSTFVSWPIAIVLTIGVLSGRWVADQLGSALDGSLGRGVVQQMLSEETDAAAAQVVEQGFNVLGEAFTTITRFLPPLGTYDLAPAVERGLSVPWDQLLSAAGVTLAFALPLLSVAYVVVRNKEVAP